MPEVRLIDANALIKDIAESIRYADEWAKESSEKKDKHGLKYAIDTRRSLMAMISRVKEFPILEAEPVRHGKMIEGRYPNENKCSECGQVFRDDICFIYPYDENGVCKTPKRCPECGCYWDGGADNG